MTTLTAKEKPKRITNLKVNRQQIKFEPGKPPEPDNLITRELDKAVARLEHFPMLLRVIDQYYFLANHSEEPSQRFAWYYELTKDQVVIVDSWDIIA